MPQSKVTNVSSYWSLHLIITNRKEWANTANINVEKVKFDWVSQMFDDGVPSCVVESVLQKVSSSNTA
jgi:hypothetical protein